MKLNIMIGLQQNKLLVTPIHPLLYSIFAFLKVIRCYTISKSEGGIAYYTIKKRLKYIYLLVKLFCQLLFKSLNAFILFIIKPLVLF